MATLSRDAFQAHGMRQRLLQPVRDELCGARRIRLARIPRDPAHRHMEVPLPRRGHQARRRVHGRLLRQVQAARLGRRAVLCRRAVPARASRGTASHDAQGRGPRSRPLGRYRGGVMERRQGRAVPYSQRRRHGQRHRRGPGGRARARRMERPRPERPLRHRGALPRPGSRVRQPCAAPRRREGQGFLAQDVRQRDREDRGAPHQADAQRLPRGLREAPPRRHPRKRPR